MRSSLRTHADVSTASSQHVLIEPGAGSSQDRVPSIPHASARHRVVKGLYAWTVVHLSACHWLRSGSIHTRFHAVWAENAFLQPHVALDGSCDLGRAKKKSRSYPPSLFLGPHQIITRLRALFSLFTSLISSFLGEGVGATLDLFRWWFTKGSENVATPQTFFPLLVPLDIQICRYSCTFTPHTSRSLVN